jgi:Type II secretion system (T2SS), protein M subtype b
MSSAQSTQVTPEIPLSPPVQRALAITLLIGLVYGFIFAALVPSYSYLLDSYDRLQQARLGNQRLTALDVEVGALDVTRVQNESILLRNILMQTPDAMQAQQQLRSRVQSLLSAQGLAIQSSQNLSTPGSPVSIELKVTGPEAALMRALSQIENASPMIIVNRLSISVLDAKARTVSAQMTVSASWTALKLDSAPSVSGAPR